MTSKRSRSIDSSGIRRMFDLSASLKDPVNLSIGIPDFDAPDEMKATAKAAIDSGKNSYTVTQGIPQLRESIRAKYGMAQLSENKLEKGEEFDCLVTSGVSGGLFLSYAVVLDPGDEILIPDPYFGMYRDLARLLGAVPVTYNTYPDFGLPLERIEAGITSKTRAILINSPSNPTGVTVTESELNGVIEIAKRKGLWIIYDEIYELFCYDAPHQTPFRKYDKLIVLNGLSKSHGVPGWRLGYAVAPREIVAEMTKLQQYSFVCAPSMAQWGMAAGMPLNLQSIQDEYRRKRNLICDALRGTYEFVQPGGAFYLFPKAPGGKSQAFIERCIAENLLVVAGNVFSDQDTHFRISFSTSLEKLQQGAEILIRLAR